MMFGNSDSKPKASNVLDKIEFYSKIEFLMNFNHEKKPCLVIDQFRLQVNVC